MRKVPCDVRVLRVLCFAVEKRRQPLPAFLLLARALLGFALHAVALGAFGAVAQRVRLGQIDLGAIAPRVSTAGCAAVAGRAGCRFGLELAGETALQQLVAQGLGHDVR